MDFGFFLSSLIQRMLPKEFSSVQSFSRVWLIVTWWTAARWASLSITNSQSPPKHMSIELVIPSNHLILCRPPSPLLSLSQHQGRPQSFPPSGSFPVGQLFTSGGQSIGVSASTSVLPVNTQWIIGIIIIPLLELIRTYFSALIQQAFIHDFTDIYSPPAG